MPAPKKSHFFKKPYNWREQEIRYDTLKTAYKAEKAAYYPSVRRKPQDHPEKPSSTLKKINLKPFMQDLPRVPHKKMQNTWTAPLCQAAETIPTCYLQQTHTRI
jgi:hypothetical protein